jgi:hypothetical protein
MANYRLPTQNLAEPFFEHYLTQLLHFEKFSKKLHLIFSQLAFLTAKSGL